MDAIFTPGIRPTIDPKLRIQSLKNNVHISSQSSVYELAPQLPRQVIRVAIERISSCFPELNFFYMPTIDQALEQFNPVLLTAIMAHAAFFTPFKVGGAQSPTDQWLGSQSFLVQNYVYEKLALEAIFNDYTFLLRPDLEVAQALLLLSIVKWGHNEYYAAWMLHGSAVRMIQALEFDEHFQSRAKYSPFLQELKVRTFWCAFCLDRIISTGENRCFIVSEYENMTLPKSDRDFIKSAMESPMNDFELPQHAKRYEHRVTTENYIRYFTKFPATVIDRDLCVFIKIYSIWGDIHRYMMKGGRGAFPTQCPWDPESIIGKITEELEEWWSLLPEEWKWSREKYYSSNFSVRKITLISTVNCLYYLSVIFLNREFFPFLPYETDKHVGPTEPPLLPSPPTETYWQDSARACFGSTRKLGEILNTLVEHELTQPEGTESKNAVMYTPFYAFTAFVCAIHANYGTQFYWMDPDHYKYVNDANSLNNLQTCYNKMLSFLQLKEDSCLVTKNWLGMVLKVQEMYKFVSGNKDRARQFDWGKNNFRKMKDSMELVSTDVKKIEKGFFQLPLPQLQGIPMQNINSSPTSATAYQQAQLQGIPSSSTTTSPSTTQIQASSKYQRPPQPLPAPPPAPPPMMQHPQQQQQLQQQPRDAGSHPMTPPNTHFQQTNFFSGPLQTSPLPTNMYAPFSAPVTAPPAIMSLASPLHHDQNSNNNHIETDTDKLSLLFNDQELDLLLQFPA